MQVESIAEQLFFTTVRIDTILPNGSSGSGTGFLFAHKRGEMNHLFVVSNKHVVMGMKEGTFTFHQRKDTKPLLGQGIMLNIKGWKEEWYGHPDPNIDIAVCPFAPIEVQIKQQNKIDLFYRHIVSDIIPNDEQLAKLDAIVTVTFIGYPNGIWDKSNLLPVACRGTTASPLSVDFENSPCFLIDASVFGGSSGSPVFILNQSMFTDKYGNTAIASRLLFVGVIAAVFYRTQLNQIISVPIPTQIEPMAQQQEMIDIGIVFKARTVTETVDAFLNSKNIP